MKTIQNWKLWLFASLTLGLAPFSPEPHIVGKLRWVLGGAIGMQPKDWFDLIMHAAPFVMLIISLGKLFYDFFHKSKVA